MCVRARVRACARACVCVVEKSTGTLHGRFPAHSTRLSARHFRLVNRIRRRPACFRESRTRFEIRVENARLALRKTLPSPRPKTIDTVRRLPRGKPTNAPPPAVTVCNRGLGYEPSLLREHRRRHCDLPVLTGALRLSRSDAIISAVFFDLCLATRPFLPLRSR